MAYEVSSKLIWNGDSVKKDFDDKIRKSLTESSILVSSDARNLAPEDLGNLKASITYTANGFPSVFPTDDGEILGDGPTLTAPIKEAYVGTAVSYGPYQEFGTRYMPAQEFLRPALRDNAGNIQTIFFRNLRMVRSLF